MEFPRPGALQQHTKFSESDENTYQKLLQNGQGGNITQKIFFMYIWMHQVEKKDPKVRGDE